MKSNPKPIPSVKSTEMKYIVLNKTQMKNKDLVRGFETGGFKVVENKPMQKSSNLVNPKSTDSQKGEKWTAHFGFVCLLCKDDTMQTAQDVNNHICKPTPPSITRDTTTNELLKPTKLVDWEIKISEILEKYGHYHDIMAEDLEAFISEALLSQRKLIKKEILKIKKQTEYIEYGWASLEDDLDDLLLSLSEEKKGGK